MSRTHHNGQPAHSITNINTETKTGTCSICGPDTILSINKKIDNPKGWVAICRKNQNVKRNQLRRGERVPFKKVRHSISGINEDSKSGTCSVCGPVELIYEVPCNSEKNSRPGYWMCKKKKKDLQKASNLRRTRTHETSVHGIFSITKGAYAYPGLTPAHLKECWDKQNGNCAICKKPLDAHYHIDHCHDEMIFRGLLCRFCNTGLGLFKDAAFNLTNAISYLANPTERIKLSSD